MKTHSHTGAKSIDEYAYLSHIRSINSGVKAGFCFCMMILSVCSGNFIVPVVISIICAIISCGFGKMNLKSYVSLFTIPFVFMIMSGIAISMTIESGFRIKFFQSDIIRALHITVKAVGSVSAMYTLAVSTPMNEIISLFDRLRLPEILCELMRFMYRYIFILADTQIKMKNSAVARLGFNGFSRSLHTFGLICSNLLIVSLRRATDYYNSVEARSLGNRLKFPCENYPVKPAHVAVFGSVFFLTVIIEVVCRIFLK